MRLLLFIAFILLSVTLAMVTVFRISGENVSKFCAWITDGICAAIETVLTKIIIQKHP